MQQITALIRGAVQVLPSSMLLEFVSRSSRSLEPAGPVGRSKSARLFNDGFAW